MAPPAPLACGFSECDWTTPLNVPTWELVIRVMDQHILAAHGVTSQQGQGQGGGSRQERLPRPTLDTGITEADWTFFESQWDRYKRSTRLEGQDATDQLWACASDELSRQAHDAGANKDTSEADLIALLKLCSIRAQNKLVNIVEFLNIVQEPAEPVAKFVSRVKGQAKVCDFTVKCPGEECNKVVSYSEQLVSHVIVRGLEDSEIQERVLALAATEENLDLKRISEFIYAQETGRESRKLLSAAGGLNKLSQHQQEKHQKWQNVPDLIFDDIYIMMMADLEDLQKCRQICKCWKEMISQLTKYKKNIIRRKVERRVEQIRKAGEDELPPGEEHLFFILLDELPNILTVASLAHHGMLGSVQYLWLGGDTEDVDLSSVPTNHLATLASCVTKNFEIERVGSINLRPVLDNVKCEFLSISKQSLGSEETRALVRAMESRVEEVQLGRGAELSPNITAVTLYSGQGKCRKVEVYPRGCGNMECGGCWWCVGDVEVMKRRTGTADLDRYMEDLRSWASKINWSSGLDLRTWSRPSL